MHRQTVVAAVCASVMICEALAAQSPVAFSERTVRHVRTIGERIDDALGRVAGLALDTRGQLYVFDATSKQIDRLDTTGKRARSIAHAGGGPGELQQPWALRIHRDTIYVADEVAGQHRYLTDGRWIGTTRDADATHERFGLRSGHVLEFSDLLAKGRLPYDQTPRNEPYFRHLILTNARGRIDTLMSWRTDHAVSISGARTELSSTGFGQEATWALFGDSVLTIAHGYTGVVRWLRVTTNGFTPIRTDSIRQEPREVTPDDVRTAQRRVASSGFQISMSGGGTSPRYSDAPIPRLLNTPSLHSVATRALASNDGALWVSAARVETVFQTLRGSLSSKAVVRENVWTVFPATGSPYRVTLPGDRVLLAVRDNTLYLRDTEDAFVIHVMAVR